MIAEEAIKEGIKTQEYFINMGPQHPSTHGVLRLMLELDGEIIKKVIPHIGYVHRSIEKMCEKDTYRQIVHVTDRMDYLSNHMNNEAVCLLVENALEIGVSERVKVIRTIMSELTRLSSHQLWWGVMGMDLGALTSFLYGFRDREIINDIFEETCGARLTMNYNTPGGVMFDIHPNFQKRVKDFIAHFKTKLPEYDDLLSDNVIFRNRTEGIGILSKEDAISYGITGPTGRASGFSNDIRKHKPYSAYDRVDFKEILMETGDTYSRYKARMLEMWESMSIIEQLIDNIPEGEIQSSAVKAVIKLPKGEFFQSVETARGELGVYVVSDGTKSPYRIKFRSPGFSNLFVLDHIAKGYKIADLVAMMSTIDIVVPDIDR
ncbi:MAG: NADH-quinone oxidoreductase subunit D [Cyclobacteriaceae bacterium]|nr:NADH-quinone oxidoreductase subunit D [Cyclobacteriaceae bacterium]